MENRSSARRVGEVGTAGLGGEAALPGEEQPPTPRFGNSGGHGWRAAGGWAPVLDCISHTARVP